MNAIQHIEKDNKQEVLTKLRAYIEKNSLGTKSRKREEFVYPRAYLYAYLKTTLDLSTVRIGMFFNKDHATVLNGLKIYKKYKADPLFNAAVLDVKNEFPFVDEEMGVWDNVPLTQYYSRKEMEKMLAAKFFNNSYCLESFIKEAIDKYSQQIINKNV